MYQGGNELAIISSFLCGEIDRLQLTRLSSSIHCLDSKNPEMTKFGYNRPETIIAYDIESVTRSSDTLGPTYCND